MKGKPQPFNFHSVKIMVMVSVICFLIVYWRCLSHFNASNSKSTSEPFGVVFDRTEGGAVAEAAIDHRIDGQEVCHSAGKETTIWEMHREREERRRRRRRRRRGWYRWRDSTRSGRLKPNKQCSERSDDKSFVKVNTRAQTVSMSGGWKPSLMSDRKPEFFICAVHTEDSTCK